MQQHRYCRDNMSGLVWFGAQGSGMGHTHTHTHTNGTIWLLCMKRGLLPRKRRRCQIFGCLNRRLGLKALAELEVELIQHKVNYGVLTLGTNLDLHTTCAFSSFTMYSEVKTVKRQRMRPAHLVEACGSGGSSNSGNALPPGSDHHWPKWQRYLYTLVLYCFSAFLLILLEAICSVIKEFVFRWTWGTYAMKIKLQSMLAIYCAWSCIKRMPRAATLYDSTKPASTIARKSWHTTMRPWRDTHSSVCSTCMDHFMVRL